MNVAKSVQEYEKKAKKELSNNTNESINDALEKTFASYNGLSSSILKSKLRNDFEKFFATYKISHEDYSVFDAVIEFCIKEEKYIDSIDKQTGEILLYLSLVCQTKRKAYEFIGEIEKALRSHFKAVIASILGDSLNTIDDFNSLSGKKVVRIEVAAKIIAEDLSNDGRIRELFQTNLIEKICKNAGLSILSIFNEYKCNEFLYDELFTDIVNNAIEKALNKLN